MKKFWRPYSADEITRCYGKLPHWVAEHLKSKLEPAEFSIFLSIWNHTLGYGLNRWWALSYETLKRECNIRSNNTICRYLKSLKEKNLIEVQSHNSRNNPYRYNRYAITGGVIWFNV